MTRFPSPARDASASSAPGAPTPRRRTVLQAASAMAAALVVGSTAACSSARELPRPGADVTDPDQALLDQVTVATRSLLTRVEEELAAGGTGALEQEQFTALAACLTAHLGQFAPGTPAQAPPSNTAPAAGAGTGTGTSAGPDAGEPDVRSAAEAHATVLTDAAGQAESGAFARLLASAAAGLVQHLPGSATDTDTEAGR